MNEMIHDTNFPDWLQSELDKRQWSQADLAHTAGISRAVVNKLLNRKTYPQPDTLQAISRAFKIPVETTYRAAGCCQKFRKQIHLQPKLCTN